MENKLHGNYILQLARILKPEKDIIFKPRMYLIISYFSQLADTFLSKHWNKSISAPYSSSVTVILQFCI